MIAAALASEQVTTDAGASVTIGRDLLELISTAMYVEPLTIFREYVQNATDSFDEARRQGLLEQNERGVVEIGLDAATRTIRVRDSGAGIPAKEFVRRMRSLGASTKRGTAARGFRGVGRLAGLAYAQRLTFRSRATGDEPVNEIVWDCRRLRTGMKHQSTDDLASFVEEITELRVLDGEWPEHFFEVELGGVVRQGDDRLLRPEAVSDYLAQVAPVPFEEQFGLIAGIDALLDPFVGEARLGISVNGGEPLRRPHRDEIVTGSKTPLRLLDLNTFEVPGVDGDVAAVGWIAHHDYDGAIAAAALVKGLRARVGDIQIGGSALLEDIFPETRFCSWTVGEVHILDPRIRPNGRRDDFEQNIHYSNLLNHLAPIGRDIARRCRVSSGERQRRRALEVQADNVEQQLDMFEQGALGDEALLELSRSIHGSMAKLDKALGPEELMPSGDEAMRQRVASQRIRLEALSGSDQAPAPLDHLPEDRRVIYQDMIDLIYECSANRPAAKALVDRILERLI